MKFKPFFSDWSTLQHGGCSALYAVHWCYWALGKQQQNHWGQRWLHSDNEVTFRAEGILESSRFLVYPLFFNHLHYVSFPLPWTIKCVCVCFGMAAPNLLRQWGPENKEVRSNIATIKQILTCNDWAFWSSLLFISISSCSNSLLLCLWASEFCSTRILLSNASVSTWLRFNCLRTWMSWKYYKQSATWLKIPALWDVMLCQLARRPRLYCLTIKMKAQLIIHNFSNFYCMIC